MIGRRWRMVVAGLAVVALGALAAVGTWALSANRAPSEATTSVLLEVERGTTVRALGRQLGDRATAASSEAHSCSSSDCGHAAMRAGFKPARTICRATNRSTRSSTC
jgi:hypothetical protein